MTPKSNALPSFDRIMTFDKHHRIRALREIFTRPGGAASFQNIEQVAIMLGVSSRTVSRWAYEYLHHGKIEPSRKRRRIRYDNRVESLHLDFAQDLLYRFPTLYYKEICEEVRAHFHVIYCKQQMCDALHGRGITRKVYSV